MKKCILLLLCTISYVAASAGKIMYGANVTISNPIYEDLYVAGGTVIINAPVYGDLTAAGGTIQINDSVSGDILVAGGNLTFNGYVGDDIRCIGGSLMILKNVAGDVVISGGNLSIAKNATIGSLIASGGDVHIDGTITNELRGVFGRLILSGTVLNSVTCRGGYIEINGTVKEAAVLAVSEKLVIGTNAKFFGPVNYWSPQKKVDFKNAAQATAPVLDTSLKIGREHWYFLGFTTFLSLLWYLSMAVIMIFLIMYFFPSVMYSAAKTFAGSFWRSLGYGFLFFIAVPISAVIICITIIGLPIGVLTLMGYVVLVMLATIISAVVLANWIHQQTGSKPGLWRLTFSALGIFIVLKIITLTPMLGWLLMICIAAASFGSILLNIHWKQFKRIDHFHPAV